MRQDASGLVRRVEAGEEIVITVAGRPSVRLVPAASSTWRRWDALADLFEGQADPDWDADRGLVDDALRDPWGAR